MERLSNEELYEMTRDVMRSNGDVIDDVARCMYESQELALNGYVRDSWDELTTAQKNLMREAAMRLAKRFNIR